LSTNALTGTIPTQIAAHAFTINLSGNQLTGSIPAQLGVETGVNLKVFPFSLFSSDEIPSLLLFR